MPRPIRPRPPKRSYRGKPVFVGPATRTIRTMLRTLADRGDPALMFDAEITVDLSSEPT